jgi:hypothetical protein
MMEVQGLWQERKQMILFAFGRFAGQAELVQCGATRQKGGHAAKDQRQNR